MSWAKLDDQFFTHPKVIDLPKDAKLLFLAALTYCAGQLTDGTVTPGALRVIAATVDVSREEAGTLVAAGLWEKSEAGWQVHDYLEYQPTRDKALATKQARAEAGSVGGHKSADNRAQAKHQANAQANIKAKNEAKSNPVPVPVPSEAQGMKDELLGNSSAAAPPQQDKKRVSAERQQSLGQEAVGAYQERYVSRYHQRAELVAGDAASLKDLRVNLGEEKFYRGLDNFMACEHHRVLSRRHAVAMLKGEINVWLSADAIALSYPAASGLPARASPGGMDTSPEARRARNLAYVT